MKAFKILITMAVLVAFAACGIDKGTNPEFGPNEVYIYDDKAATMGATVGEPLELEMMVSPADGSVACRWLLGTITTVEGGDNVVNFTEISNRKNLSHVFTTAGVFKLKFEATRGNHTNYRQFDLTVAEAAVL